MNSSKKPFRINNGTNAHPVITKDKSNEQPGSRHRNSPDHRSKSSDRRSRSPHRKRLRLSPTVTNDSISSASKSKYSSRTDDRKPSRSSYHRHRSSSTSPPRSSSSSSNNHKKSFDFKDDKVYPSYRSKSSRNSQSDRRTNQSSPPRISSTTSAKNDHSNKTSALTNNNSNNGSQRTRSNLIQIVTTEPIPNRSTSATKPPPKSTEPKSNSNQADDMLMEEMLLEEEQKHDPIKPIDLDSLTIPESTTKTPTEPKQPTSQSNSTPSPTKKPYYILHKVPHTNHTTPPRQKKPVNHPPPTDDPSARTSLDDRLSTLFGMPIDSSTKPTDTQPPASSIQALTPSDKSTESPQDIKSSILTIKKKERESIEERRSSTSKYYTTEWLATQKPEEAAPTEDLPSLVSLPTLTSSQPADTTKTSSANETTMIGKLSELMDKLAQKQNDATTVTNPPETEDVVPISAKHLERIERRKQRETRQSEIAAIAKEALKPAFRKRLITKEEYKQIMKKVVTKATPVNEIDRVRIGQMIDAYVEKYRLIREHRNSKDSTNRT